MDWREKEKLENAKKINDSYVDSDGIYRWKTNDQIPFSDMLECWNLDSKTLEKCNERREQESFEFLTEYKERMKDVQPSAEELFEMKAAFGEGAEITNIITGKKIKL